MTAGRMRDFRLGNPMEISPMMELLWFFLASIPFVTGLTVVLLIFRERWQKPAIQERAEADRPRSSDAHAPQYPEFSSRRTRSVRLPAPGPS